MKIWSSIPVILVSLITINQAENEPSERERKSVVVKTTKSAVNKLINISVSNEIPLHDVITYVYAMGFPKAQGRGYFAIYLNPEKKQFVVTGNDIFIRNTIELMHALETNKKLDYKMFDFKNTNKVRKLDEKLWSLGIKVNVDR